MKKSFFLPILTLVGLIGCAAQPTKVATTTTDQMNSQRSRIMLEPYTAVPHEVWGATSGMIGKDSS